VSGFLRNLEALAIAVRTASEDRCGDRGCVGAARLEKVVDEGRAGKDSNDEGA
jgi:hypothetical protein